MKAANSGKACERQEPSSGNWSTGSRALRGRIPESGRSGGRKVRSRESSDFGTIIVRGHHESDALFAYVPHGWIRVRNITKAEKRIENNKKQHNANYVAILNSISYTNLK